MTDDIDKTQGQSGGPVWVKTEGGMYYVVGVHVGGRKKYNIGSRIDKIKFDLIIEATQNSWGLETMINNRKKWKLPWKDFRLRYESKSGEELKEIWLLCLDLAKSNNLLAQYNIGAL